MTGSCQNETSPWLAPPCRRPAGPHSFVSATVLAVRLRQKPPLFCNQSGWIGMHHRRSGCPISLTLETFGDRWSLIVLRDIMFGRNRTFRALLGGSIEGIASNILSDRLKRLTANGLLSRCGDPN